MGIFSKKERPAPLPLPAVKEDFPTLRLLAQHWSNGAPGATILPTGHRLTFEFGKELGEDMNRLLDEVAQLKGKTHE